MQTLNFIPNVLEGACGLLAAGGHTAELAIRSSDPSSRWCIQTHVGKSINNSVHISPSPFHPLSRPQIHISNNDQCVYWYNVHYPKRYGTLEAMAARSDEWDNEEGLEGQARHMASATTTAGVGVLHPDPLRSGYERLNSHRDEPSREEDSAMQPEIEYIDRVRLDTSINHTSISPDGRTMVAVGDTNQAFVFDISAGGQHTLIDTLEGKAVWKPFGL